LYKIRLGDGKEMQKIGVKEGENWSVTKTTMGRGRGGEGKAKEERREEEEILFCHVVKLIFILFMRAQNTMRNYHKWKLVRGGRTLF
jgi:hypothetical protein